jgi:hypothetical protein
MVRSQLEKAMENGQGILRLAPAWVPRSFCRPGKRIKLHPDDYYALGLERGGIDERWFASTTQADNGPGTPGDEGLSYVLLDPDGQERILLCDAVDLLQGDLIGQKLWREEGRWPMFSKFFDNAGPLPHPIHQRAEHAARADGEVRAAQAAAGMDRDVRRDALRLHVRRDIHALRREELDAAGLKDFDHVSSLSRLSRSSSLSNR